MLGQKVRVSRKVDWTDLENRKMFKRVSSLGSFGNKIYTVTGLQLRACKSFKRYVAVYQLSGMQEQLSGFCFYEKELSAVVDGAAN